MGVAAFVLRSESADCPIHGYFMEGRAVCGGDAVLLLEFVRFDRVEGAEAA